jgi:hypothetical protein
MKSLIETVFGSEQLVENNFTHHASRITHHFSRLGSVCLATFFLFIGSAPAQTLEKPREAEPQDELAQAKVLELQAKLEAQQAQQESSGEGVVVSGGSGGLGGGGGGGFGGGGTAVLTDRLAGVIQRGAGKTLVIHSSEPDPKDQSNLEEDLSVMSHILNKAVEEELGQKGSDRVLGINVYFAQGPGSFNNLYLDGYGAVFMLNVGFPLLPPPAKAEEEKEKPAVDSAWEEAREELYGGRHEEKPLMGTFPEYSEQNVTKLKEALLEALKNATNIRNLKADESVTLCVFGGGAGQPRRAVFGRPPRTGSSSSAGTTRTEPSFRVWDAQSGKPMGAPRGSTMTIRVKKSDIDAFAKGKLTLDEFRKTAKIATYSIAMTGVSGTSSWFGSSSPFGGYSYGVSR